MTIRDHLTKALYFSVGAVAVGVEALGELADALIGKGETAIKQGKEMFNDFRAKYTFPDDEDPAVIIEEDTEEIPEI